jgi:hypothetical protein
MTGSNVFDYMEYLKCCGNEEEDKQASQEPGFKFSKKEALGSVEIIIVATGLLEIIPETSFFLLTDHR